MTGDDVMPPAGRFDVLTTGGLIRFGAEADLRDGLAAWAWLAGWTVATEVPVMNGGRVDLVLTHPAGGIGFTIEIKKELRTLRQLRQAFQQADGYKRFFPGNATILTAVDIDDDLSVGFIEAYPLVALRSFDRAVDIVRRPPLAIDDVAPVALRRRARLTVVAAAAAQVTMSQALARRRQFLQRLTSNYEAMAEMLAKAVA